MLIFPVFLPFFVVITKTPLAASDPQTAAADAPFKTVIDSISSSLISFNLDCWDVPATLLLLPYMLSLLIGTPSKIINGCVFPLMVFAPLICMLEPAPGSPFALAILTPEAFPCKELMTLISPEFDN